MSIISRILGSLEARLSQPRLSLWRTAYLNFRTLPFRQAIKFPIFIYGRVRLFMLNGSIEIAAPIRRGMITIGRNNESFSLFDHSGFISLGSANSVIRFEGAAQFAVNCKIRVVTGTLTVGDGAFIGSGVRIICNGSTILIGDHSRIAFDTVIMNSGFHFVYNSNKQSVGRLSSPVIIGSHNWIGNRSTVTGGAVTPDYCIICNGSLVNKDYSTIPEKDIMLAGTPAKMVASGVARVFNEEQNRQLFQWFKDHPDEKAYHISPSDIKLR